MHGHDSDAEVFQRVVGSVRQDIVTAVQAWRARGNADHELALLVDGQHPGKPIVSTATRKQLALTITDFEPTIAIEFARYLPDQVPAIVDLRDYVRRVVWVDLTTP